ncbi:MAG: cell division protein FtsX [Flavobacteriales bacterium]
MAKKKSKSKGNLTSGLSVFFGITLVLFMLGIMGLFLMVGNQTASQIKNELEIQVMLRKHVNEAETQAFKAWLDQKPYTRSTKSVTREEAAEELQKDLEEDFLDFMGQNPLPASVDLKVKTEYTERDSLESITSEIGQNSAVRQVIWHPNMVEQMQSNFKKITFFLLVFSGILLLIAIALINNTIRLAIFSKRFLIRSMQLVGATSGFIQKPFLLQSIWRGILAGLTAFCMILAILYFFKGALGEVSGIVNSQFLITFGVLFLIIVGTGILISFFSTKFAVRKYLRIDYGRLH